MNRISSFLVALGWALSSHSASFAEVITFAFEGEVTSYLGSSAGTMAALPLGSRVAGSYSFESSTPDSESGPEAGTYDDAITAINFSIAGGSRVRLDPNGVNNFIRVISDSQVVSDTYFASADVVGEVAPGIDATIFSIQLFPGISSAFATDALPLTPPSLSDFPNTSESILFIMNVGEERVDFTLSSLTLIPEPTTLSIVGFGIACLASRRLRSTSRRLANSRECLS